MSPSPVRCPQCQATLADSVVNQPQSQTCPECGAEIQIEIFPALFRAVSAGGSGEAVMVEGESACFYHPAKKAVRPCDGCGRFLCALCDCELHGEHYCPACLEVGKTKGKIKNLENRRTLYDSIALSLAVYPVILIFGVYFTFITAPMALYVAIRFWNAPRSLVHRTRTRYILAITLAAFQIIGWGVGIVVLTGSFTKSNG